MSSKARLVITAIEVEGRSPAEVCAAHGVSRSWLYELPARYRAEGDAAFTPRSKRPHTSPTATPPETVGLILLPRREEGEDREVGLAQAPTGGRATDLWDPLSSPRPEPVIGGRRESVPRIWGEDDRVCQP